MHLAAAQQQTGAGEERGRDQGQARNFGREDGQDQRFEEKNLRAGKVQVCARLQDKGVEHADRTERSRD